TIGNNYVGFQNAARVTTVGLPGLSPEAANSGYTFAVAAGGGLLPGTVNDVVLSVTGGANRNLVWDGTLGPVWDLNATTNWKVPSNTYMHLDNVTFDDTATGSSTVTLNRAHMPMATVFNNSLLTYTLNGAGRISGSGGVTFNGTGTVILDTDNDYTGTTTINAGTVIVGTGGTTGVLGGTGNVTNNGTLAFNRSDYQVFNRVITGTGAVVKDGAGNLLLTAANAHAGGTTVQNGDLIGQNTTRPSAPDPSLSPPAMMWDSTCATARTSPTMSPSPREPEPPSSASRGSTIPATPPPWGTSPARSPWTVPPPSAANRVTTGSPWSPRSPAPPAQSPWTVADASPGRTPPATSAATSPSPEQAPCFRPASPLPVKSSPTSPASTWAGEPPSSSRASQPAPKPSPGLTAPGASPATSPPFRRSLLAAATRTETSAASLTTAAVRSASRKSAAGAR
ncbi:MAG: autotransporter-associated beta strand repeat-containing protein, partial [Verrucomicrobiales bacterium]|nr:autotransporter-associated beta strand repeat-containing protein [Verrucomicrobiales bacterium]